MKAHLKTFALLGLIPLSGCSLPSDADFSDVLPDDRILVNLPMTDTMAKDAADGAWSEYYLLTVGVTRDVNALIGLTLTLVDYVTQLEPSAVNGDENHAVWGPYSDALDPVETLLRVQYHPADDTYSWAFQQKPRGADDSEYVTVIAGEIDEGATRELSSGRFAIDFEQMHQLDPNVGLGGLFYSEYAIEEAGVQATAAFEAVDDGDPDTVDAVYAYEQTHGGDGAMDVAWLGDATGNGEEEAHVVRSRWTRQGEGRSDAYLTGGQLGDAAGTVSECWDANFNAVYRVEAFAPLGWEDASGDLSLCAWAEPEWSPEAE